MNSVNLIGRLGADPVRKDLGGTVVTTFTIAVYRRGESDKPDWVPVVAFGKSADFAFNYLAKGRRVGIIGHLRVSDFQDGNGNKRRSFSVVSNIIVIIDWPLNRGESLTEEPLSSEGMEEDYDPFALE